MKYLFLFIAVLGFHLGFSREKKQIVEVACGQCQFKMKAKKGCDLAVRIDGKSYFVEGTKLMTTEMHTPMMVFVTPLEKAEVIGDVKGDKFVVSYFKLYQNLQKVTLHSPNCGKKNRGLRILFLRNLGNTSVNHIL